MQQFLGLAPAAGGRPTDGLKTWQRTALGEMGLLAAPPQRRPRAGDGLVDGGGGGGGGGAAAAGVAAAEGEGAAGGEEGEAPVVAIGGTPPVSGPLLAALRVMLSEVGPRGGGARQPAAHARPRARAA